MIGAKEAYELFLKIFPNAEAKSIYYWGDFYTCATDIEFYNEYRIDSKTGEIREMDFLEHVEELRKHPNDEDVIEYKVKDLLALRVS